MSMKRICLIILFVFSLVVCYSQPLNIHLESEKIMIFSDKLSPTFTEEEIYNKIHIYNGAIPYIKFYKIEDVKGKKFYSKELLRTEKKNDNIYMFWYNTQGEDEVYYLITFLVENNRVHSIGVSDENSLVVFLINNDLNKL